MIAHGEKKKKKELFEPPVKWKQRVSEKNVCNGNLHHAPKMTRRNDLKIEAWWVES